jgi:two-component system OmpR family response regulator
MKESPLSISHGLEALSPAGSNETQGASILVVEDEREIAKEIRLELEALGHFVRVAQSVEEGLSVARSFRPSILVIDRMLGGADGLSIVEALRQDGDSTPVLVVSGLSSVDERIVGLKAGGDDYLVKPFDVRELGARVEALLRRGDSRPTRLRVGVLDMDLVDRKVRFDGQPVQLLPREFKLLEYFMRRPGRIVTRTMLLEDVWNFKFMAQTNVVDVQIGNLRRKLDPTGKRKLIVNVRAVGFRLDAGD